MQKILTMVGVSPGITFFTSRFPLVFGGSADRRDALPQPHRHGRTLRILRLELPGQDWILVEVAGARIRTGCCKVLVNNSRSIRRNVPNAGTIAASDFKLIPRIAFWIN